MQHTQIWRAIDLLAARHGLTASGLARAAGLDPTTFNKSKRMSADGKPRWPSTESLARALEACQSNLDDFAQLTLGRTAGAGRTIPIVGLAKAGAGGFFDETGFPTAPDGTVRFPGLGDERVYALEITGDSMEPVFRDGGLVVVQPGVAVRKGDRVVVRTHAGEAMAKALGRRTEQTVELVSLNPAYPVRTLPATDIDWMARIVWASQ
jgi:phage repressor protein C with HTH and peptisase S24 domain